MPKLKGPLFSLAASGSVGKTLTYVDAAGGAVVRKYATPSQPHVPAQTFQRATMAALVAWWQGLDQVNRDAWDDVKGKANSSGFNKFLSENLNRKNRGLLFASTPNNSGEARIGSIDTISASAGSQEATCDLSFDPEVETNDLTLITLGTDTGANTTADTLARIIGFYVGNDDPPAAGILCKHLPTGTYYLGAITIGGQEDASAWKHTSGTISL